jgi:hypothetical protein
MKFKYIFYPFLVAILPILIIYSINLGEVQFSDVWRSILFVTGLTVVFSSVLWLFFRNWHKVNVLTACIMISALSYGHLYDFLKEYEGLAMFARHRFLLLLYLLLLLGIGWVVWKRIQIVEPLNVFFSWFSVFMLISPAYAIGSYYLLPYSQTSSSYPESQVATTVSQNEQQPDIYYIILDAYGRQDTLQRYYTIDNSEFIDELGRLGFYVASESTSNYPQTLLSVASSLNYQYIDNSLMQIKPKSEDRRGLTKKINHSRIRETLRGVGYDFIAFDAGYYTSADDADNYYKYLGPQNQGLSLFLPMNPFEGLLFEKSIMRPLLDYKLIPQQSLVNILETPYTHHAGRILFIFDKLTQVPDLEGNHFAFAHIIAPHPPFVFGPNGEMLSHSRSFTLGNSMYVVQNNDEYIKGYRDELPYLNSLVIKTVEVILAKSKVPPIIIIQGDHGPGTYVDWDSKANTNLPDRFSILNAYYFGKHDYTDLYPSISPVNTFRVVLNVFFGTDLELLPDICYFSLWDTPFQFEDVTTEVTKP